MLTFNIDGGITMKQYSNRGLLEVILDAMETGDNKIEVRNACIILGESTIADTQAIRNFFSTISNARLDILKVTETCMAHEYDIAFILCANNGDLNALAAVVSDLRTINCHGIVTVFDIERPKDDADYGDLVYLLKDDIACEGRLIEQGSNAEKALIDIVGCVYNVFADYDKRSSMALTDRIDIYPIKEFRSCYGVDILKCEGNFVKQPLPSIVASLCKSLEAYSERARRLYIHILGSCSLSLPEVNAVSDEIVECVNKNADIEYGMHIDNSKPKGYIEVTVVVGFE